MESSSTGCIELYNAPERMADRGPSVSSQSTLVYERDARMYAVKGTIEQSRRRIPLGRRTDSRLGEQPTGIRV
jgi:hypothetical protein